MKINIVLPYENSNELVYTWAKSENEIDFRKDFFEATRCTISFAATEIMNYMNRLNIETIISSEFNASFFNLFLDYIDEKNENCNFKFKLQEKGFLIEGDGRIGVLYGAYEFLRMQGIRWLNPDSDALPEKINEIKIPDKDVSYAPSMDFGRGFDFEGLLKESTKLYLWMARNRLNLSSYRANTYKFQKKIGMIFKNGGHIFEKMLNPENKTEDGASFWDAHRDWYGAKEKKDAAVTQFCTSNEEALEYLSQKLVERLNGEWYYADRIDVWGFDTWDKTCECDKCKKLGNGSDKWLYFISYLRAFLNKKIECGELDHNVTIVMCSYEGTSTISPPVNGIPENLKVSGDAIVFYPINRCYNHDFADADCHKNKMYNTNLTGWKGMPVIIGEYYNVSKFEDFPLVFTNRMVNDMRHYYKTGIRGATYMHLPMKEWGVRNITQLLYAQLTWNIDTNVDEFVKQYYIDRYGKFGKDVERAYLLLEDVTSHISAWRSWDSSCVLSQIKRWDGKPTQEKLFHNHLNDGVVKTGNDMLAKMNKAIDILKNAHREETDNKTSQINVEAGTGVNPLDTRFDVSFPVLENLEEDIRLLKYATLSMELLCLLAQYHDEWSYDNMCDELWKKIEQKVEEAIYLYTPIKIHGTEIELLERDVLERSQLKTVYYRCKRNRKN